MEALIYVILGMFSVIFMIEVYHDDQLRKIRNFVGDEADDLTDNWHKLDFWSWVMISIVVMFLYFSTTDSYTALAIPFMIGSLRVLILNIWGNKLAQRGTFYLGEGWLESRINSKIYYLIVLLVFLASVTLLVCRQHFGF